MKEFFNEAYSRLRSGVPPFFRKVQVFGASLATLGATLQAVALPSKLLTMAGYVAVSGGVMVAVAQFAEKQCAPEDKQAAV